jgi:hypothetical protein
MTAWNSWPYEPNRFAIAADTSSPAAASSAEVGADAAALASLTDEPIPWMFAATDAMNWGSASTNDTGATLPND